MWPAAPRTTEAARDIFFLKSSEADGDTRHVHARLRCGRLGIANAAAQEQAALGDSSWLEEINEAKMANPFTRTSVLFRTVRLLRMLKLARVLKASRVLQRHLLDVVTGYLELTYAAGSSEPASARLEHTRAHATGMYGYNAWQSF